MFSRKHLLLPVSELCSDHLFMMTLAHSFTRLLSIAPTSQHVTSSHAAWNSRTSSAKASFQ